MKDLCHFLPHLLVSQNPEAGGEGHGDEQGEAGAGEVEDVQQRGHQADHQHRHVEQAQADEPRREGDKLLIIMTSHNYKFAGG